MRIILPGELQNFEDGFRSDDQNPISIEKIKKNYDPKKSENRKLYFLHGAFHIYENPDEPPPLYKKIRKGKTTFFNAVSERFETFKNENTPDVEFKGYEPVIILEDRHFVKKAQIEATPLLSHCFKTFKEGISGTLVIFGCGFKKDKHILKAIKYSKYKKIYVCFLEKDKQDFQTHFSKFRNKKYKPVLITKEEEHFFWKN